MAARETNYIQYGARLKELREQAGLTQYDLAGKLAIGRGAISMAEQGRNVLTGVALLQVAEMLGTNPTEIGIPMDGVTADVPQRWTAEEKFLCQDYGNRIRKRRVSLGLKPGELAGLLEVHPNMLLEWEHGRAWPPDDVQQAIAAELGVKRDDRAAGPAAGRVGQFVQQREAERIVRAENDTGGHAAARAVKIRNISINWLKALEAPEPDEDEQAVFEANLADARRRDKGPETDPVTARQANIKKAQSVQRAKSLARYGRLDPRNMTEDERNAFNGYGRLLKQARLAAGLTCYQAEEKIGITNWPAWESGGTIPSAKARKRIEEVFGVPEPEMPAPKPAGKPGVTILPAPEQKRLPRRKPERASTMLDYVCILAADAGMSYGDYVALVGDNAIRAGWQRVLRTRGRT